MAMKPRYSDCRRCVRFASSSCVRCGAGEFFEPELEEKEVDVVDELDLDDISQDWSDEDE